MDNDDPDARAPLMGTSSLEPRDGDLYPEQQEDSDITVAPDQSVARASLFVWTLTLAAGISGLLFGYDTGIISATLVSIRSSLSARPLTTLDKSLITSSTSLFALFASPIAGILADRWGRKRVILLADGLFVLGALAQAGAGTVGVMVMGRSVVGLAVGGASQVVPLYITELSPSPFRGRLITVSILFITIGQVMAYIIGFMLSPGADTTTSTISRTLLSTSSSATDPSGWRYMVGLGALPAAIQSLILLFFPETPRWLVRDGRVEKARQVLGKVYGSEADGSDGKVVEGVLRGIVREVDGETKGGEDDQPLVRRQQQSPWFQGPMQKWTDLFADAENLRALKIACSLQALQQLCGFNSLMYFSSTLFLLLHYTTPTLPALSIATTNLLFTVVALLLIDRVGRRKMLLTCIPGMILTLLLAAGLFSTIDLADISPSTSSSTSPKSPSSSISIPTPALLLLPTLTLYTTLYALSLGPIPWTLPETFSLQHRSRSTSLATATNWSCNFLVGISFLPLVEAVGATVVFVAYAGICLVGWWVVGYGFGGGVREMRGRGLEGGGGTVR
ncbi:MAG: hypothetical protein M1817_006099 [Caeruleum heppii]|nr:MAG: hypothetical protein M1817_006099 [Caeruleum heppii]